MVLLHGDGNGVGPVHVKECELHLKGYATNETALRYFLAL
jgi:hypothetical protein